MFGNAPYPEYTKEFPYIVPLVLFGAPAFLLGLNALTEKKPDLEAVLEGGSSDE